MFRVIFFAFLCMGVAPFAHAQKGLSREAAEKYLARQNEQSFAYCTENLKLILKDPDARELGDDWERFAGSFEYLRKSGDRRCLPLLREILQIPESSFGDNALDALGGILGDEGRDEYKKFENDPKPYVAKKARELLAVEGGETGAQRLKNKMKMWRESAYANELANLTAETSSQKEAREKREAEAKAASEPQKPSWTSRLIPKFGWFDWATLRREFYWVAFWLPLTVVLLGGGTVCAIFGGNPFTIVTFSLEGGPASFFVWVGWIILYYLFLRPCCMCFGMDVTALWRNFFVWWGS